MTLQSAPKAELHLHLEGSIRPETVRELAPGTDLEQIRSRYRFPDFAGFIESFKWVTAHLRSPDDYALITRRLLEELASQNVRYAEITLAAGVAVWRKLDFAAVYDAVRGAAAGSGVTVYWILDAIRHFGAEHALEVARLAADRVDAGCVAFGIGGDEARGPAGWFREVFAFARSRGLRLTAHAGETSGPESVWQALEIGAERIGHGISSASDPALLRHLRQRDIPLEICVTSNVATGAVAGLADHPLRRIFDAGVPVILNSDDPAIFDCTLTGEYELARDRFGFSQPELEELLANGFRYAFRYNR
ncbi:MAG TPA: adenosine deaminase [Bryobacteraceae bacterium]|jgi:adenosine deaminase/aminodeoxyfutalosine deaminase|nr:adenosine deaminase [Bryobacteraceae bacterium]